MLNLLVSNQQGVQVTVHLALMVILTSSLLFEALNMQIYKK